MNDPRHPLTAEVQELICNYVRAGGFPHVAAEAAGIPVHVFESWMRWGKATRPVPRYRDFREAVRQAQAISRLAAEAQALRRAPLSWLRYGPGRETGHLPGWTDAVKPVRKPKGDGASSTRLQELIPVMLDALDTFPERAHLAEALEEVEWLRQLEADTPPELAEMQAATPPQMPIEPATTGAPPVACPEPTGEPPVTANPSPPSEPTTAPQASDIPAATAPQATDIPPATAPQSTSNESATNPQPTPHPTGNETAAKPQPTSSDTTEKQPDAQGKEVKPPPKKEKSIWERFKEVPWVTVYLDRPLK